MWNVVIFEARHEQQMFPTSISQRLDVHIKYVGDVELLIVVFSRRYRDNMAK
jgi:hypothetical protein